jgi:hypothetical protein
MQRRVLFASLFLVMAATVSFCQEPPSSNAPGSELPSATDSKPPDPVGPLFRGEGAVPSATLIFKFENPQLQPARFEITLHGDGAGHFISHTGSAPPTDIADLPPEGQDRDIVVTDASRERIFAVAQKEHGFAIKCDSGAKKIAYQGTKTLIYQGPDAHGSCTYNYSNDAKIEWLTSEMLGIAATLEEGRRLAVEHAHGRLTLDAELETLANMVHDGDATEIQNIAPILQSIIVDESIIQHARRRAQALLDSAPLPAKK